MNDISNIFSISDVIDARREARKLHEVCFMTSCDKVDYARMRWLQRAYVPLPRVPQSLWSIIAMHERAFIGLSAE